MRTIEFGCFRPVHGLRIGQKVLFRWFRKFEKSAQKRGLLRVFLPRPHRKSWAAGSGELCFSAPECEDDLGVASACMPPCPLEVDFSKLIPIFLVNFCDHGKSDPRAPSRRHTRRGRTSKIRSHYAWGSKLALICMFWIAWVCFGWSKFKERKLDFCTFLDIFCTSSKKRCWNCPKCHFPT